MVRNLWSYTQEQQSKEKAFQEDFNEFLKIEEQLDFSKVEVGKESKDVITVFSEEFNVETYKIVGYAFDTYIIVQKEDSLYLIDQHAVHERRLFELLKEEIFRNKIQRQILLSPIVIELPISQKEFALENVHIFEKLGFEIDDFGKNEIVVRTYPLLFEGAVDKFFILDIIEMIYNESVEKGITHFSEELLKKIACRAAVKGNMNISDLEKKR